MLYDIPILTGAAAALARKPKLNLETRAYYSPSPVLEVAEIEQSAVGGQVTLTGVALTSGSPIVTHASATTHAVGDVVTGTGIPDGSRVITLTDATHTVIGQNATATLTGGTATVDLASTATLALDGTYIAPATGYDMQIALLNGCSATAITRIRLDCVLSDGTNGYADGVFAPPSYADSNPDVGQGMGADFTPSDPTKTIRSFTSLSKFHGGSVGLKLAIWKLPEAASWVEIPDAVQKNITPASTMGVAIPRRDNPALVVKKGRGEMSQLNLSQRKTTAGEGIMRLNGQYANIMFITRDNGVTMCERDVYCETFLQLRREASDDGNGEQMVTGTGAVAKRACFV